jgi:hypothetical protein
MRPRLVACYFGTARHGETWNRMARVLAYTAERHCPRWEVSIERITPAAARSARGSEANVANTQKLEYWAASVLSAPDGQEILLMDADTAILRGLDDVWRDRHFDVAYTYRDAPGAPTPLNAGVIFLRASARSRLFLEAWRNENRLMIKDAEYHRPWFRKYGGINQAALGKLIDDGIGSAVSLLRLRCTEWNCEDYSWKLFDPELTRILHVKSSLRRTVFLTGPPDPKVMKLVRTWRDLEREATGVRA